MVVIEPAAALQEVTLDAENCCFAPRRRVAVAGAIVKRGSNVTVAVALPPGPVAVIVSVPLGVIVAGAVYRPAAVIVPASALHAVTLLAENCSVAASPTVTAAGEIIGAGCVDPEPTETVSALLCQVPGLFTKQLAVPVLPM